MTCLFHDVYEKCNKDTIVENRIIGMKDDKVLYADDTILLSEDNEFLKKILRTVQEEGKAMGLRLNKEKSVILNVEEASGTFLKDYRIQRRGAHYAIKFDDGTPAKTAK